MAIETKKSDKSILNNVLYIRDKVIKDEFCIIQRAKNTIFRRKFRFNTKSDYKKVLLNLTVNDYVQTSSEEQTDEYGEGSIHVFLKEEVLYNIHGDKEKVTIYIKVKIPDEEGSLPIISFHESVY